MVKPKPKAKGTIFDSVFEATKVCHLIYQIIQVYCFFEKNTVKKMYLS